MRIAAILFTLGLSFLAAADGHGGEGLRPVSHEDLWTMRRLGTPVTSPDGKWAVVPVTEPAYEEDDTVSDLWLVAVDGKTEPRRLTATKDAEAGLDWSPDGTRIAFSAKRGEDVSQVYVMDMTMPGEAQKITSLSTGAAGPRWSPDGKRIAFESRVYPGTSSDEENAAEKEAREERDYNATAYDIFRIRQWNRWRDDLQTHVFVQDAVPGAEATDLLAGTDFVAAPGFSGVPSLASESLLPAWTPDGQAIVISATQNLDDAAHSKTLFHLYRVPAAGGEPQALTSGDEWSCQAARFAPGGDAVYCLYDPVTEFAYNLTEIARFEWPESGSTADFAGEPTLLTAGFDRSVADMATSRDQLSELAEQAARMGRAADLPVFVDADHGYGNALNVMRTVEEMEAVERIRRPTDVHTADQIVSMAGLSDASSEAEVIAHILNTTKKGQPIPIKLRRGGKEIEVYKDGQKVPGGPYVVFDGCAACAYRSGCGCQCFLNWDCDFVALQESAWYFE